MTSRDRAADKKRRPKSPGKSAAKAIAATKKLAPVKKPSPHAKPAAKKPIQPAKKPIAAPPKVVAAAPAARPVPAPAARPAPAPAARPATALAAATAPPRPAATPPRPAAAAKAPGQSDSAARLASAQQAEERRKAATRKLFARLRSLEAIVGADLRKRGSLLLSQAVDQWYAEAISASASDVTITNAARAVIAQL
jgi:hypothetical protein